MALQLPAAVSIARFLAFVFRKRSEIDESADQLRVRERNDGYRLSVDGRESSAQRFVSANNFVDASFEDVGIDWTSQPHCQRNVVNRGTRDSIDPETKASPAQMRVAEWCLADAETMVRGGSWLLA